MHLLEFNVPFLPQCEITQLGELILVTLGKLKNIAKMNNPLILVDDVILDYSDLKCSRGSIIRSVFQRLHQNPFRS